MNRSSSGTQNGSATIAGWSLWRWPARAAPGPLRPASRENSSTMPRSCPGASTNVGWSWTSEHSRTAGGAGRPASSAATHRLAAWLVQACSGSASIARQESSVNGRHAPPGHAVARSRSALGRRWLSPSSRKTGAARGPSTSMVPRQMLARSTHRSNCGSTDPRSSSASRSAIGTPSVWTAASATVPAGPSRSSSPRTCASARASGACSEASRIHWRPRRSRRSSASCAEGDADPGVRAAGARCSSVSA